MGWSTPPKPATKLGNRPVPKPAKEHIANLEQIVYSAFAGDSRGRRGGLPAWGAIVAGPGKPGHKEHDSHVCSVSSRATPRRRIVHGQIEGSRCRALPDRAQLRQGLDHA